MPTSYKAIDMKLVGQTALITGGGRGIGLEVTKLLVDRGASVHIVGREIETLMEISACHPDQIFTYAADLSEKSAVDDLITYVRKEIPDLSILINNAGSQTEVNFFEDVPNETIEIAREEIALNMEAPIALSIGLLRVLKTKPNAAIVNITSALAIAPKQASPTYCAAKSGLRSFTKALRYQCQDNAPHIQVTEAIMAYVDTDMTRGRSGIKITPQKAAQEVMNGLEHGADEIWVGKARYLKILNRISPKIVERILR